MSEVWKDIEGYEGLYQIGINSQVKSLGRIDSIGRTIKEKILKSTINSEGYYQVELFKNGIGTNHTIHKLIAKVFIPNPLNLPCINHIDTNRLNNDLSNLEWCTYSHNNSHAHKVGAQRNYYGENHHQSKLTADKVKEIRSRYLPRKCSMQRLADEYGVSKTVVQQIIERKTWKDI